MSRASGYFAGAVLMSMLLATAEPAKACVWACVVPAVRLFGPDAYVPGNLVYFKVQTPDPGQLSLRTAAGEPIRASIRMIGEDRVFAPDNAIPGGTEVVLTYEMKALPGCSMVPAETPPPAYRFMTTEPVVPREMRQPTLELIAQGTEWPDGPDKPASFADLRYRSGDVERAYSHLTTLSFAIDGMKAWYTIAGPMRVSASCSITEPLIDSCGFVGRVAPGEHTVTVTETIVGFPAPPPAQATVNTVCDSVCAAPVIQPQSSVERDGGGTNVAFGEGSDKSSAGGCSASFPPTKNAWWLFAATGLLAMPRKRRRV